MIYWVFGPKAEMYKFEKLKDSPDVILQLKALSVSVCSFLVSAADLISHKHLVSSAKIKGIANLMCSGKSLMKITNSSGPSTLAQGTPDRTLHSFESESPTLTH